MDEREVSADVGEVVEVRGGSGAEEPTVEEVVRSLHEGRLSVEDIGLEVRRACVEHLVAGGLFDGGDRGVDGDERSDGSA